MSREIKFRCWNKNRMVYCDEGMVIEWVAGELKYVNYAPFITANKPVVMQYTGLKDKNGKEIYEGDIVEIDTSFQRKEICEVVFKDSAFGCKDCDECDFCEFMTWKPSKVIGNIYENPELIEAK